MVTPAAKRQAVAHFCASYEVSHRRACHTIGAGRTMRCCVPVFVNWHRSAAGSAIAGFSSCFAAKERA